MAVGFYPCCGRDFEFSAKAISPITDTMVFCDRSRSHMRDFRSFATSHPELDLKFEIGDARDVVHRLGDIVVFFHRGVVAPGEGSADIYFFGKKYFSIVASKLVDGGMIISDGNGSGDKIFSRMLRAQGYTRFGWHFAPCAAHSQPDEFGLYRISVKKLGE